MAVKPVFLFSLPRSGSTMLQRALGRHPNIATLSESWFLLGLIPPRRNRRNRRDLRTFHLSNCD